MTAIEVFGDLLPAARAATEGSHPIRDLARLMRLHPDRKGVLLACMALHVARKTRNRRLALRVLKKAYCNLTDDYCGYKYAHVCGIWIFQLTRNQPKD